MLTTYIIGCLALIIKPGPDLMCTLATAIADGKVRAATLMAGLVLGCWFWILLLTAGVASFFTDHPAVMTAIQLVGITYIGYLASGSFKEAVAGFRQDGADAAGGEGRGVRLADDEVLAAELHDRLAVFQFKKRIVLLGGGSGHWQKPVRVVRSATVHCPVADAVRHFPRDGRVERLALPDRRLELLRRLLAQVSSYRLVAEHVFAEVRRVLCLFRHVAFSFPGLCPQTI